MTNPKEWLPTPAAAVALGCSQSHLKRNRDDYGGPLRSGTDYRYMSGNAPIQWHVDNCREQFHRHGQLLRAGAAAVREVQA